MFNIAPIMGNLTMEQQPYEQTRASVWKGQHLGTYQAPTVPSKVNRLG